MSWLRSAVLSELAIWRALARWVARRPDVPPGSTPVGYAQMVTPTLWLWIFACTTEVVVVHVLLPWEVARWVLFVVGVWSVVWMVGLLASYRVRPHLVGEHELRVRNGPRTDVGVPLNAVAAVVRQEQDLPGIRAVHHVDGTLSVAVSSRTNLEVQLTGPTELETPGGRSVVDRVALWVDDPRAASAVLRHQLSGSPR